ncbi:MAG TPA: DUF3333 domain-containing protein, partial [Alphaproteobacteria bacterium]|nr:DUF3333 domain-containing protein [Alphaproteobacteria bacterium]
MTDATQAVPASSGERRELKKRATTDENVRKRYAKERRFKAYGMTAVGLAVTMLVVLMVDIVSTGYTAFFQNVVALNVTIDPERLRIGSDRDPETLSRAPYRLVVRDALKEQFPSVEGRRERRSLYGLVSNGADLAVRDVVLADPSIIGTTQAVWVKTSDDIDTLLKGQMTDITRWEPPGIATPIGTQREVRVSVGANAFTNIVADVNDRLEELAEDREDELETLRGIIEAERAQLDNVTGEQRENLQTAIEGNVAEAERLAETIADLRQRAASTGGTEQMNRELPSYLVKINGGLVKVTEVSNSEITGQALVPLDSEAEAAPGTWEIVSYETPAADRRVSDQEIAWISVLQEEGNVENRFNWAFFQTGDSREPELAGIWGAVVGSFYTLVVTLLISFPIGVLAATYLEEFAPKNRWTDLIEVNINNLAAVPSIVFGLLGLAVFLNFFGLPRSAPVVGGMVLALMTLPTIIIASRAALKSVPPSIRQAALGMGASRIQTVTHHVLPLAMPGILTGTIIGMAQALGETAPLLMIGMVAFIVDIPGG